MRKNQNHLFLEIGYGIILFMERRSRTRSVRDVSIETSKYVVIITMETLTPAVK